MDLETQISQQGMTCFTKGLLKGSRGETDLASLTGDIIPTLKEVRTFDLSLHKSMECHQLVEEEAFWGI